jgi:hypothetical protein
MGTCELSGDGGVNQPGDCVWSAAYILVEATRPRATTR